MHEKEKGFKKQSTKYCRMCDDCPGMGPCHSHSLSVTPLWQNLEQAQNWADADPYIEAGVYEKVIVKPFKKVF